MAAPRIIAISGKARSGKDTVASHILDRCGDRGRAISFASPLYVITEHIQRTLGKTVGKDPGLLQRIGQGMRDHYGEDVWVDLALGTIEGPAIHVITDLRYRNEMAALTRMGATTIRVIREDRPVDRDPAHQSEVDLDDATFDHVIHNNGTMEELLAQVDIILATMGVF